MLEWVRSKFTGETYVAGFEIGEPIFEGAFSDIYKAYYKKGDREVALKILTKAGAKIARMLDKDATTMWEGELLESFDHPNIIKCIDCGARGGYWIAMELIRSDLGNYIGHCDSEKQENKIVDILSQAVAALDYVHERGLVHRDICLGNMLLDEEGTVKLIDFGMAVPQGSKVVKGRVGTPSYMAPEMIKKWQYTVATDIYSFGIVMYELITGEKPFQGQMREQRMTRSLNLDPIAPTKKGKHCCPELQRLVMKCISKDPKERPQTAHEIEDALFLIRHKRGLT